MEKFLAFGVTGLATGAIYAIAASGLVLTYTTSGIFNFAHGAIGMVSAFLYWQLRFDWQWPTWLSILLVLFVFAPLFGASIERFILRGLQGSSEVTKVIVTVGLMVGLIGLVGWIWPSESRAEYRPFFDGEQISLGGNNITYHTIITVAVRDRRGDRPAVAALQHACGCGDAGGGRQPRPRRAQRGPAEPDQHAGVVGEHDARRPRRHPARRHPSAQRDPAHIARRQRLLGGDLRPAAQPHGDVRRRCRSSAWPTRTSSATAPSLNLDGTIG